MSGCAAGGDDHLTSISAGVTFGPGTGVRLRGDAGTMSDHARGGDDTLTSHGAPHVLLVGDADTMLDHTRGGNDRLVSGEGVDEMYGDAINLAPTARGGHDTFVFGPDNGQDNIHDFHHGEDKIDLRALNIDGFASLDIEATATDSVIHLEGDNQITVANNTHLVGSDFVFQETGREILIDFEGIAPPNDAGIVAFVDPPYKGLTWSDLFGVYDSNWPSATSGYDNVINSGIAGGYNGGEDVWFTSPNDFDLQSGYFAAGHVGPSAPLVVEGWDDGALVATSTIFLSADKTFVKFDQSFDSIDEVHFRPGDAVGPDRFFAMDDLLLKVPKSTDGDGIVRAKGTDIGASGSNACGDGSGDTELTDGGAMLHGMDPRAASGDWFVSG
jgi:hypothetical protein